MSNGPLALDGVYTRDLSGDLSFHDLPPPTYDEVATVAARTAKRVEKILDNRGISFDDDSSSELGVEQPVLTQLLLASTHGIDLFGERAMMPSLRLVTTPPSLPIPASLASTASSFISKGRGELLVPPFRFFTGWALPTSGSFFLFFFLRHHISCVLSRTRERHSTRTCNSISGGKRGHL